jgi:hypothetical protein
MLFATIKLFFTVFIDYEGALAKAVARKKIHLSGKQ